MKIRSRSFSFILGLVVSVLAPFQTFASKDFLRMSRSEEVFMTAVFWLFVVNFICCLINVFAKKSLLRSLTIVFTCAMAGVAFLGWTISFILGIPLLLWMLLHVWMIWLSTKKSKNYEA